MQQPQQQIKQPPDRARLRFWACLAVFCLSAGGGYVLDLLGPTVRRMVTETYNLHLSVYLMSGRIALWPIAMLSGALLPVAAFAAGLRPGRWVRALLVLLGGLLLLPPVLAIAPYLLQRSQFNFSSLQMYLFSQWGPQHALLPAVLIALALLPARPAEEGEAAAPDYPAEAVDTDGYDSR